MIGQNDKHLYYYDHLAYQQDLDKDKHLKLPKTENTKKVKETKRLLWQAFNLYYQATKTNNSKHNERLQKRPSESTKNSNSPPSQRAPLNVKKSGMANF